MNKNLEILRGVALLIVLGGVSLFLIKKQLQNNVDVKNDSGQQVKNSKQENAEGRAERVNYLGKFYNIDQYKTIEEFINSLPEISLEKLGIEQPDMSNWQTYRNEKWGFVAKYPRDWTIGEVHDALKPTGSSNKVKQVIFNAPGTTSGGGAWSVNKFTVDNIKILNDNTDLYGDVNSHQFYKVNFLNNMALLYINKYFIKEGVSNYPEYKIFIPNNNGVVMLWVDGEYLKYVLGFVLLK